MLRIRIIGYVFIPILISLVYRSDSGKYSGCSQDFAVMSGESFVDKYISVSTDILENIEGIMFIALFGWFGSIFPLLLTFPKEINIFFKVLNTSLLIVKT
jgi:hypothetical protein